MFIELLMETNPFISGVLGFQTAMGYNRANLPV